MHSTTHSRAGHLGRIAYEPCISLPAGAATVSSGGLTVSSGGLTVPSGGGSTSVQAVSAEGAATFASTSTFSGAVYISSGGLTVSAGGISVPSGGGSTSVQALSAAGAATFASSVSAAGPATLGSTLSTAGAATFSSSLGVTGAATLSGQVTVSSGLQMTAVVATPSSSTTYIPSGASMVDATAAGAGAPACCPAGCTTLSALHVAAGCGASQLAALHPPVSCKGRVRRASWNCCREHLPGAACHRHGLPHHHHHRQASLTTPAYAFAGQTQSDTSLRVWPSTNACCAEGHTCHGPTPGTRFPSWLAAAQGRTACRWCSRPGPRRGTLRNCRHQRVPAGPSTQHPAQQWLRKQCRHPCCSQQLCGVHRAVHHQRLGLLPMEQHWEHHIGASVRQQQHWQASTPSQCIA